MLTRFVRTQLIIFTVASIVGVAIMMFAYVQLPTLLGLGRLTVTLDLPATGGLYKFSNVTYRGLQVGKVTSIELTDNGARATLSLDTSPKIPADLKAEVRSMSAVGEQYVELLPRNDKAPYLQDGSVIPVGNTAIPQAVGPMLDQVSKLVDSIPKDKLSQLLGETYQAFNGTGYDFGSLVDSGATITRDANAVSDNTRALIDDARPFVGAQEMTTDSIRTWAQSLAGITEQVANNDPQVRSILHDGPGFAQETSQLLEQIKPTLPVLLANLTTFGQILLTYNKSIEQLMVLVPPFVAQIQTYTQSSNPAGIPNGEFSLGQADPAPCTVGFLPPSSWRNPADTSVIDTPDGMYCKLPQDSPIAVRGARNYPCMEHPGKRAPTVELCNDPNGFQPIAQRQHVTGPYPIDPNLVAQGIPVDNRVLPDSNIFGPLQGTPLPPGVPTPPPGAAPIDQPPPNFAGTGPGPLLPGQPIYQTPPVSPPGPEGNIGPDPINEPGPGNMLPPDLQPPPPLDPAVPQVSPSAYTPNGQKVPALQVAKYDPRTGQYMGSDGTLYRQTNLAKPATTWQDMFQS
ncbi:mammalian cell entry protein [Mycolicibacterium anyangense]|uniref:Mammalian cell entry protein n=1 Tax=Mycolicibacterium anyangense TaxID=1431246 RepID=A0A6N4WFR7_9MYCO|nr:MlaD family protein [Mycolicibacterium anyangense]BBZ78051.1 mammalian cell entry protein [Mycolicibacterium anyangense]